MKKVLTILLILSMVIISACSSKEDGTSTQQQEAAAPETPSTPGVAPAEPTPSPTPAEAVAPTSPTPTTVQGNVEVIESSYNTVNEDSLGWKLHEGESMISEVKCGISDSTAEITFTLLNPTTIQYIIAEETPIDQQEHRGVQININGKGIDKSEAAQVCGSPTLDANGKVSCTVQRTLRKRALGDEQRPQTIQVRTLSWTSKVIFMCQQ